jgi:hypothetical protein
MLKRLIFAAGIGYLFRRFAGNRRYRRGAPGTF